MQKGIFTLGEENKQAKQNIEQNKQEIEKLRLRLKSENGQSGLEVELKYKENEIYNNSEKVKKKTWEIKKGYTGGDRVLDKAGFLSGLKQSREKLFEYLVSIKKPDDSEKNIEQIEKEVQELGDGATQRIELNQIDFNSFSNIENNSIFNEVIVGNENSTVADLIKELSNQDWVKQGIDKYVDIEKNGKCPFCQQETLNKGLVNEIRNYFDASYQDKINKLNNLRKEYEILIDSLPREDDLKKDFFAQEQNLKAKNLVAELVSFLQENLRNIENKISNPSQTIEVQGSKEAILKLNTFLRGINEEIKGFNTRLENRDKTINKLKEEFWAFQREKYDLVISNYFNKKEKIETDKNNILREIEKVKREIERHKKIIHENQKKITNIHETIDKINVHLLNFGITEFKVVLEDEEEKTYRLQRGEEKDKIFTTLSQGEKTVISFLYFIELCIGEELENSNKEKIIVIDDPISSLSHIYVFNISSLIKRYFSNEKSNFSQCFILTHNLYFFNELIDRNFFRKNKNENYQKLFRIIKQNASSQIFTLKPTEIQNEYQVYWSVVKDEEQENGFLSANAMRNIIEYFFGFINKSQSISEIFSSIEGLKGQRYDFFKQYMERESHSDPLNSSDYKDLDVSLFKDAFEKVFKEAGFEEHYIKMMK